MTDTAEEYFDVTLVRVRPRTVPSALARVATWLDDRKEGVLVGCLFSDLGMINQILMLRQFGDIRALLDERARTSLRPDSLGIGEFALDLTMNIAVAMPGVRRGAAAGPFFEVRIDVLQPGSLGRAIDLWQAAARHAAPSLGVYTIAGDRPSIVHIWPWASLDQRALLAEEAVPSNIWRAATPCEAPLLQRAEIFRAAAFSPMQ